jgi:hypothetical protein
MNDDTLFVSHLLFTDDTRILCGIASDNLRYLGCVLCFEVVSGLKINLAKSKLVLVGDVPTVNALALILGCRLSSFPLNVWAYLWGAPYKAKHIWDIIID